MPGAWDLFHIGHLNLLLRVRPLCDHLIVGVATDAAVHAAKQRYPVVGLAERMQIVGALGLVDQVVVDQGSKLDVYKRHRFNVLFKGDDWQGTPKGDQLVADMASVGVRVEFLTYTQSTSSTVRARAKTGHRATPVAITVWVTMPKSWEAKEYCASSSPSVK